VSKDRTHCRKGHELTPENTKIKRNRGRPWTACLTCHRATVARNGKLYKQRHPEKYREIQRRAKQRRRAAHLTKPVVITPEQNRAYRAVWVAIQRGLLVRGPCGVCGDMPAQAHHPHGYGPESQLDVVWLCPSHHKRTHLDAA